MKTSHILMLLLVVPLIGVYFSNEKTIYTLVTIITTYGVGTMLAFEIEKLREEIKKCR